jgi:hypothetical protein
MMILFIPKYKRDTLQAWYFTPVMPALGRLRQKDYEFKASLS